MEELHVPSESLAKARRAESCGRGTAASEVSLGKSNPFDELERTVRGLQRPFSWSRELGEAMSKYGSARSVSHRASSARQHVDSQDLVLAILTLWSGGANGVGRSF